ncbi:unnamed protein product, partial [Staurois parvus]
MSVLISASCQCPSVPYISAYQYTSMPHISAHLSCLSVSPISTSQCHLSMPISATYQCHATDQCLLISVHQCSLSVPISAASLAHISEGEKSLILQNFY